CKRTRSSSNLIVESSTFPKRRNRRRSKLRVEPFSLEETPVVTMADQQNFKLKHGLLNLVTSKQFYGIEKEDPHAHIRWFNKITSTIKYKEVPNSSIKLMLFPFSIEGASRICLEKEPPRSILTCEDLVSKFMNQFFPPSKTTNLRNEITNFQQRFDESFCEEWDHFKDLLRACPHHGFTSKVYNSRNRPVVSKVSTNAPSSSTPHFPEIAALADVVKAMILQKSSPPAFVKAVEEICATCGGLHPYHQCLTTDGNAFLEYRDNIQRYVSAAAVNYNKGNTRYRPQSVANYHLEQPIHQPQVVTTSDFSNYIKANDAVMKNMQTQMTSLTNSNIELKNMFGQFMKMNTASTSGSSLLPSNTVANPRGDLKEITTRSGISYDGPPILPPSSSLPKVVEREPEVTKDKVLPSMENIQPSVVQIQALINEPVVAPKPKPSIPYPSRANKQRLHEKDDNLSLKFVEIFRELHFELSFADAPLHMPKFALMFKKLVKCLALADLGASINLTPLSIRKKLSLPELTPTQMILELADRSTTSPSGIAEDVFVKVGKLHFPADFVVVDYVADPRVSLILVGQTSRYSYNDAVSINRIDVIDVDCEEYAQEVLGFSDSSTSGNPTLSLDPILSTSSSSLTPFEEGDFILEEIEACLTNDLIPPGIDDDNFDPGGDLLLLEKLLNDDPSSPLPPKELHVEELKIVKSSIDDPPELELKYLPSHLEYAFLEGTDKLPVIIAKNLKEDENVRLLKVLKSHKCAIAWKISDIKGIDPQFCTHKILMEDDSKQAIQHQRRVNPKIHEVIKKEVIKLFDA
ncbi:reverse transcriptase domain-containing protein, partial [Tanacetum coccineum]